jgi:triosephosphate isomerase
MVKRGVSKGSSKPLVIINFKTYELSTGEKALELAKICDNVAKDTGANIIVAVSATDIAMIVKEVSIPVYAQHIDPFEYGSHTGHILPQVVKYLGAQGTLLNHSERRLRIDVLEESVLAAKKVGLKTVVCANDAIVGEAVHTFQPDYIAVEPPELIGGTVSVSNAKPQVVRDSVNRICGSHAKGNVLVGAGIKNNKDFKKSLKLGAIGILLASGITKAKKPEKTLRELIKGIY